jgi:hypothetical protein
MILVGRWRSQAIVTCMGVAPRRAATSEEVVDWSGVNPPSAKNGT